MPTGGISGLPLQLDGKTAGTPGPATATPTEVVLNSVFKRGTTLAVNKKRARLRSLSIRHLSGAGDLRVYLNGSSTFFTIKPNESWSQEALIHKLVVGTSAGSVEWEGTGTAM